MVKQEERFETFRDRAEAFFRGARIFDNDQEFHQSQALLCVHAAISFADAVAVFLNDRHFSGDSHSEAVSQLRKACASRNRSVDGLDHLSVLIGAKNSIACGDSVLRPEQSAKLLVQVERFAAWVYRTFPELAVRSQDP